MKSLDFNTLKKSYFTVTLPDEKCTKLMIKVPVKKMFDEFIAMERTLKNVESEETALDEIYELVAKLMSNNKTGVKITPAMVEEMFDFEDIIIFIQAYADFIGNIANAKN